MMTGQNSGFAGPRNVASNAFLRQSPSPSALQASPAGLGAAPSRYLYVLANISLYIIFYVSKFDTRGCYITEVHHLCLESTFT